MNLESAVVDKTHLGLKGPRSWELGSDLLAICDTMADLERECLRSHPIVAKHLSEKRHELGVLANDLMESGGGVRMAPETGEDSE